MLATRQRTGLADEMWREIAPLLAEEGITEDTDPTDLPTLQAAGRLGARQLPARATSYRGSVPVDAGSDGWGGS
ncbi:hypothetical protein [Kitasatospora sp. NPDC017646]|uniref:hypothetical protein n=1 Tax=Kitasatospora sp. NPDC017646 TaxID=3364024 RepID=UPI003799E6DE